MKTKCFVKKVKQKRDRGRFWQTNIKLIGFIPQSLKNICFLYISILYNILTTLLFHFLLKFQKYSIFYQISHHLDQLNDFFTLILLQKYELWVDVYFIFLSFFFVCALSPVLVGFKNTHPHKTIFYKIIKITLIG